MSSFIYVYTVCFKNDLLLLVLKVTGNYMPHNEAVLVSVLMN